MLSIVWEGHWPISVCQWVNEWMNEGLMVNTLKASFQTQASQSVYLASGVWWELEKNKNAAGMTNLEWVGLI